MHQPRFPTSPERSDGSAIPRAPHRFLLLALLLLTRPSLAQAPVEYLISLPEPQTQTVSIAVTFRGITDPTLEVSLPVWRPGKYALMESAGAIRSISAKSGAGKPIPIVKIEKSSWVVKPEAGDQTITVEYILYANALGDRARHIDDSHAFLSPSAALIYAEAFRDKPHRVQLDGPQDWTVATGLEHEGRILLAPNYDILVDSPIEFGIHELVKFDVDGTPHEIAFWSGRVPLPTFDRDKLTKDLAKIITRQRDMFGVPFPYQRYIFLVHVYPGGGGGTEHLNSTVMQCGPSRLATPESLRSFFSLASHEYFHTYNVKQLRPAGLKPYDYLHENYTELLWVAEGVTSYFDDLTLARVGIKKPDDYLSDLSKSIDSARRRPGAAVQSVEDSSFDSWIKFNKPSPDAVNSTVSFYDKGAHAGLLLDMELRRVSGNKVSLDTILADLYKKFPLSGPGYTTEDVIQSCERLAAANFRSFFAEVVRGTAPLDFEGFLATAGLEVVNDAAKEEGSDFQKQRAFIGLNLDGSGNVTSALSTGPAYRAGLIAGDSVAAFNGQRIRSQADLDTCLKTIKPGDSVRLAYFRYDQLRDVEFKADGQPDGKWVVKRLKTPTDEQKAIYESWIGSPWPEAKDKDKEKDKDKPEAHPDR